MLHEIEQKRFCYGIEPKSFYCKTRDVDLCAIKAAG